MMNYVIISPVRNEGEFIQNTLDAVIAQTVKPTEWIIVNDGSNDDTAGIIASYTNVHPWIKLIDRPDRGYRKSGAGVMEAFYDGYNALESKSWNFIVKLDGDVTFDEYYFENCFNKFAQDSELGICGGIICYVIDGQVVHEKNPVFHVRGATKIYRSECWFAIGGLVKAPGWDTIDEFKANMLGWKSRTFSELNVIHHRVTGSADGTWRNAIKDGLADYVAGYHPVFMAVKCIRKLFVKPYFIFSIGIFCGFMKGYICRIPQVEDERLIRYIRHEQLKRLTFRSSIWK